MVKKKRWVSSLDALREMLCVRYERPVLSDVASDARDAAAEIAHPALDFHKCMKVQRRDLWKNSSKQKLRKHDTQSAVVGERAESQEKPDLQHGRKDFSQKGGWQGDSHPLFCMALGGGLRRYVQQRRWSKYTEGKKICLWVIEREALVTQWVYRLSITGDRHLAKMICVFLSYYAILPQCGKLN